jgi:hypothetical protein
MEDQLASILSAFWFALAFGAWPIGFLFATCSPCCGSLVADTCAPFRNAHHCVKSTLIEASTGLMPSQPVRAAGFDTYPLEIVDFLGRSQQYYGVNYRVIKALRLYDLHLSFLRILLDIAFDLGSLSLPARPAVGETRSYIYRLFGGLDVAINYEIDNIGPPWFLQIDVFVTGVETLEESSVSHSLGTDEYGQVKLVFEVNQGPGFTHTTQVPVELTLTGRQRVTMFYPAFVDSFPPRNEQSARQDPVYLGSYAVLRDASFVASSDPLFGDVLRIRSRTGTALETGWGLIVYPVSEPLRLGIFTSRQRSPFTNEQAKVFTEESAVESILSGSTTLQFQADSTTDPTLGEDFASVSLTFEPSDMSCRVANVDEIVSCELSSLQRYFMPTSSQPGCGVVLPRYKHVITPPLPTDLPVFNWPFTLSSVPCAGCDFSLQISAQTVYGSTNPVEVLNYFSGPKAGSAEVIVKRVFLGGESATFSSFCNGSASFSITAPTTAPLAVNGLTVSRSSPSCDAAVLSWLPPDHDGGVPITAHVIQFRVIGQSSFATYSTVGASATSATVLNLFRVGYDFRVAAINSNGTGPYATVTTGFALAAPTSLTLTRTSPECGTVNLSWTAPTQSDCVVVASYRLELREVGNSVWLSGGIVPGTQTVGAISGLATNARHQFRVARVADTGVDLFTNTVTSGNLPFTPQNIAATLGATLGEVDLTWTATETQCFENTDYNIQFRPSTTTTFSDFPRTASASKSGTVTELTPGVQYFLRVRAVNAVGVSFYSSTSSITLPNP